MCYSDIIPLYSSERLNDPDTFPYVTSWTENEGTAKETTRYMEYPVATGLFQWINAKLTEAWLSVAEAGIDAHIPDRLFATVAVGMFLLTVFAMSMRQYLGVREH